MDKEQQINIVVSDLVKDLKIKDINFDKHFGKSDPITDQQFIAWLKKAEFEAKSEQLELLRIAFQAEEAKDKISLKKMKLRFNTVDPSYLNKGAPSNIVDAKTRLSKLPESVRDSLIKIDDYLQRKGINSKRWFRDMDVNKDGTISKEEFQKVLIREYRIRNFTIEQLGEVYQKLDQNNSNSLTIGEFMYYIDGAHQSIEERKKQMSDDVKEQMKYEINRLWDELDEGQKSYIVMQYDPDKDGKLSKKEFEEIMLEKMMNDVIEDEDAVYDLNSMFHNADINKDGYLSIDELYIMFNQFDVNISKDEIISFMREIDVDKDGRLDIDEFIALMTMDMTSFKNSKSVNTGMKMKRANKIPVADIARYFKMMPKHFIDSFTTKLWKKGKHLPSSIFKPKINPETLLYEDLQSNIRPKNEKDYPLLGMI